MVFLKYICKVLLSMRYLSKNGSFNTFKSPCLINADHYSPRNSVIEASGCINSPFLLVGVRYSCRKQFIANPHLFGSLSCVANAAQSSFLSRHTNELIKIISS